MIKKMLKAVVCQVIRRFWQLSDGYYNLTSFVRGVLFNRCCSGGCHNKATHTVMLGNDPRYYCEEHATFIVKLFHPAHYKRKLEGDNIIFERTEYSMQFDSN